MDENENVTPRFFEYCIFNPLQNQPIVTAFVSIDQKSLFGFYLSQWLESCLNRAGAAI